MISHYITLILAILLTAVGQLFFKFYFNTKKKIYLFTALSTFIIVPICSLYALSGLPIDTVYMSTSVTIVIVLFGGYFLLGEKLMKKQILGSIFIILGIIIYNL